MSSTPRAVPGHVAAGIVLVGFPMPLREYL